MDTVQGRSDEDTTSDKRIYQRTPMVCPVRFWSELLDFESKAEFDGEVLDVSKGGLFIRSEFLEARGTPVSLMLFLPNSSGPLPLSGRVAWVVETPPKGPGMGIELFSTLHDR